MQPRALTLSLPLISPSRAKAYSEPVLLADEGHLGVVKALVETVKPKPETSPKEKQAFTNFLNRSNSYGQTALMMACKTG